MGDELNGSQSANATIVTPKDDLSARIDEALKNVDDKGKVQFPEDVDPLFKRLVNTEKSARDNKAAYTKSRQELAEVKAAKEVLESKVVSNSSQLSEDQIAELDDLKYTDPDAYFAKRSKYEQEAKARASGELIELTKAASTKALQDLTLVERQEQLHNFQVLTGIVLTDDVMANDIPPRLQRKISEMPFEEYLKEVAVYLTKGKVIKPTDDGLDVTNISLLAGGSMTKKSPSTKYQII